MTAKLRVSALLTAAVLILAACTTNPFTGERQVSRTAGLGIGGAIVGGVFGAALSRDDRLRGALIGAGIGGIAGGGVGLYMDRQEAALREELEGTGVSVTRDGDQIILNMPGDVTFDINESRIKSDFQNNLNGVAMVMEEYESTLIAISGHTDITGSRELNMRLSEDRAQAVADYLAGRGVQEVRLYPFGEGPDRPIASNDTAEGRQANRRVELVLEPIREEDLS
ncbi:MAG: OmpA family protein [Natronospirillum sp.]|uniref:OmpA family protein n=1 Tax=Natronospirillum sp. TaxID=2812955 RepID=UPI0025E8CF5E|nr:OmpA family protein [Natronospirillum sp.]MCH8552969.1 OmpA family protein [Natronospirillum sp.]